MPPLLQLQKLPGKGDGGWEKSVFALFFGWPEDWSSWKKKCFGASYSMSNKLLLIARHILTMGLQKMSLKLAVENSRIHCHRLPLWRKYAPEVKAAKGLKWCRAKVKGVNNPAWTAQYWERKTGEMSAQNWVLTERSRCLIFWHCLVFRT